MSMKYIREHYNVPAKRGMKVNAQGHKGVIVGSRGPYLRIRIRGGKNILSFHPTWEMEYQKEKENMEEQTCENCYYHIYKEECPVPFETQGQLSSTGTFYCPYWAQRDSLAHTLKCFGGEIK